MHDVQDPIPSKMSHDSAVPNQWFFEKTWSPRLAQESICLANWTSAELSIETLSGLSWVLCSARGTGKGLQQSCGKRIGDALKGIKAILSESNSLGFGMSSGIPL